MRSAGYGLALILLIGRGTVEAQTAPAAEKPNTESIQTFYLTNVTSPEDGNQIYNAVRYIFPQNDVRTQYVPAAEAIIVRGTSDQLTLAQKVISELDRPRKSYRLTYTLTEMDGGKRVGTPQHFALVVAPGQRTTVHLGSKVPIAVGTYSSGGANGTNMSPVQTQYSYVDVGTNFDATLDEVAGGGRLKSKVEQTSAVAENGVADPLHQPVVRQATLEGMSMLTLGKPLVLGSLDIPGSAAHMDVEVVMEAVK